LSQLIKNAKLSWNENGEPSADLFDDLYFSSDDGLNESRYVFIEQNKLDQRWQACKESFYVIAETGFGSGLNFLATWQHFNLWRQQNPSHCLKRLYFISFEKYPLTHQDLATTHQRWPELAEFSRKLRHQYPSAIAGCHRQEFNLEHGAMVILDLWLGDIKHTLPSLHSPESGLIDCWFLDGFAPRKNPEMWNETLYRNMASCTKDRATLATFTAAGDVRRGLIAAGFDISKVKGYGKKREMISGQFLRNSNCSTQTSWFYRHNGQLSNETLSVTIVGGGIASACTAFSLAKRGFSVTLLCKDERLAVGASGNRQGGFYPLLNANNDQLSQFYSQAFGYARNHYQSIIQSEPTSGALCGVLQLGYNEQQLQRQQRLIATNYFSADMVTPLNVDNMNEQAGVEVNQPGLYYPLGGWISPKVMTHSIIEATKQYANINIVFQTEIDKIERSVAGWKLTSTNGQQFDCRLLILSNGHRLTQFSQTQQLPMYATAGQVSHPAVNQHSSDLKSVLCYQGYITPASEGLHCIGASFNRDINDSELDDNVSKQNIDKLIADTKQSPWTQTFSSHLLNGKIGVRMSVKDHLPMVGNVPDFKATTCSYGDLSKGKPASAYGNAPLIKNLYMLGGLGSRGICSAPLLGEVLAGQLTSQPQPLSQQLLNQLSPNRYWIKRLKQGKTINSTEVTGHHSV